MLEHGLADPGSRASPRGSSWLVGGVSSARQAAGVILCSVFFCFVVLLGFF